MLETLLISLTAVLAAASSGFSLFTLSCMKRNKKQMDGLELHMSQLDSSLKLECQGIKQAVAQVETAVMDGISAYNSQIFTKLDELNAIKDHVSEQMSDVKSQIQDVKDHTISKFGDAIAEAKRQVTGIDRRFCHWCNRLVWRFESFVDGSILCHDCQGQGKGPK